MPIEPFILAAAAALTLAVSYSACLLAARLRALLDEPGARSSHQHATPRTGGVAIIAGFLTGLFVLAVFSGDLQIAGFIALIALSSLFALVVGLADDRASLPPGWKFFGQIAAAALFVGLFEPLEAFPVPFAGDMAMPFALGAAVTMFWIVGFINVFNFMDGANGLAGGVATVALSFMAIVMSFSGAGFPGEIAFLLAVAVFGFLPQNFLRGRLFMGDGGSHALGFLIAALAVLAANWTGGRMSFLVAPIIFAPFLCDVFWTLVSRALRRQPLAEAHREHLYQLLMRQGMSHVEVAALYLGLVCISAAAAIVMLALPPARHWLVPAALALAFVPFALRVTSAAAEKGLLATRPRPRRTAATGAALNAAE